MSTEISTADFSATRIVASLALVAFMSGFTIVTVYDATLPAIKAHKAQALRDSVLKVLPGATSVIRLVWRDAKLVAVENGAESEEAIFAGLGENETIVGYAIPGSGAGFQDVIRLMYGYRPQESRIIGLQILDSRETPGIGDKIFKDAEFRANFINLAVTPTINVVKKGKKSASNEVDAITGATISSKAIVRILNAANELWLPRLPKVK
jgi:electron transport complex protein RnfG